MKINELPEEFQKALPIIKKIQENGFEAYFVGGCVRDTLLGKPINDVDIATSATPQQIKNIFPKTIDIGIEHGTVLVLCSNGKYEVTTYRTEGEYQDYRRPDSVEFVTSLKMDLERRDFTINAFALGSNGEVIDKFNGEKDLGENLIRAVGNPEERFHEDALRMMRGIRFAAQLENAGESFKIEDSTFQAIQDNAALIDNVSVERILIEFQKMMQGKYWQDAFQLFIDSGLNTHRPTSTPKEKVSLMLKLNKDARFETSAQVWAVFFSIIGKPIEDVSSFLKKWTESNEVIRDTKALLRAINFRRKNEWTTEELYLLTSKQVRLAEISMEFFDIKFNEAKALKQYNELPIHSLKDLAITGGEILEISGKRQGKWLGELLHELEQTVLHGKLDNDNVQLRQKVSEDLNTFEE